jgi:hypothetical protein
MSQARDLAEIASGNTIAGATPKGGLVHIETKTVADSSSSTTAFDFTDVFSADYNRYYIEYNVVRDYVSDGTPDVLFVSLSNANTRLTNECYGAGNFWRTGASSSGALYFASDDGVHQLGGNLASAGDGYFRGQGYIYNPFSTSESTQIQVAHVMAQDNTGASLFWHEDGMSSEGEGHESKATDALFGILVGSTGGTNVTFSATQANVYGEVAIFGVKGAI